MIFLTEDDFDVQIRTQIMQVLTGGDKTKTDRAELQAIAEMKSYLAGKYDVPNIFNKSGLNRNPQIIMFSIDILLYHLHSNISHSNVPELREKRYDAAINWLKMVASDKLNPDLPILPADEGGNFIGGGNVKNTSRW